MDSSHLDEDVVPIATEEGEGLQKVWRLDEPESVAFAQGEAEEGGVVPQYLFPLVG